MSNKRNGFGAVLKKFCQTKMETQSCEYGFIFLVHLWCLSCM